MIRYLTGVLAALILSTAGAQSSPPGKVEVLWLGQSCFRITTPGGKVIVTDPWLIQNPRTPPEFKKLEALGKVDVILVSHGHADHFADAPALAKMHKAPVRAPGDMNASLVSLGILPAELAPRFNKGGTVEVAPGVRVTAVRAEHSSVINFRNPVTDRLEVHYGANPLARGTAAEFVEAMGTSPVKVLVAVPGQALSF